MPKEKNYNPVQAQRKADKAKAIKKGKAEVQDRRNEKLARKNPDRIQKQIDDIKVVTTSGGKLSRHEEQVLEGLEKELKVVNKAREALGDEAPTFRRGWGGDRESHGGMLGKRRRGSHGSSSDEEIPEEVRKIPMPRDTPPPIPKEQLDRWYAKRRAKREAENAARRREAGGEEDDTKMKGGQEDQEEEKKRRKIQMESKTVYEAAPVTRDLRREAVTAFMPSVVQQKLDKGKGQGGLLEPEEADKLEREGYLKTTKPEEKLPSGSATARMATVEDAEDGEDE